MREGGGVKEGLPERNFLRLREEFEVGGSMAQREPQQLAARGCGRSESGNAEAE